MCMFIIPLQLYILHTTYLLGANSLCNSSIYNFIKKCFPIILIYSNTTVVRQTLDRQTLDTTNPRQTNGGHTKRRT